MLKYPTSQQCQFPIIEITLFILQKLYGNIIALLSKNTLGLPFKSDHSFCKLNLHKIFHHLKIASSYFFAQQLQKR